MKLKTLALAPLLAPQALWVATRARRLCEASGERTGEFGDGPPARLLILGDSSAAGVGVATQTEALGGRFAYEMSQRFSVKWRIAARCGATVRTTIRRAEALPDERFDYVLIALGVNDAKNGVSLKTWATGYRYLLRTVSEKFGARLICVSGLPPLRRFPALPRPLNEFLGDRAERFDEILRRIVDEREDTRHLPLDFTTDASKLASDGLHPGPEIYSEWARRAADLFADAGH